MIKAKEVTASRETDALIHNRVFNLTDAPPPYSTDEKTAEWLLEHFGYKVMPVYDKVTYDPETKTLKNGPTTAYMIYKYAEPDENSIDDIPMEILAQGETFPLAVSRAVLVDHGIVTTNLVSYAA